MSLLDDLRPEFRGLILEIDRQTASSPTAILPPDNLRPLAWAGWVEIVNEGAEKWEVRLTETGRALAARTPPEEEPDYDQLGLFGEALA